MIRLEADLKASLQYLVAQGRAAVGPWSAGSNRFITAFLLELIGAPHPCGVPPRASSSSGEAAWPEVPVCLSAARAGGLALAQLTELLLAAGGADAILPERQS